MGLLLQPTSTDQPAGLQHEITHWSMRHKTSLFKTVMCADGHTTAHDRAYSYLTCVIAFYLIFIISINTLIDYAQYVMVDQKEAVGDKICRQGISKM